MMPSSSLSAIASLELTAGSGEGVVPMSFTREGTGLPMIARPSVLYRQLFASPTDQKRTEYLRASGRSSLDAVREDARRLQRSLPATDRDRLDDYFASLRAVEQRLGRQRASGAVKNLP